jgi:hypothetical protein
LSGFAEVNFSSRWEIERLLTRTFRWINFREVLFHALVPQLASSSIVTLEFWVSEDVRLIWSTANHVNCPGFRHYGCPEASGLSTLRNWWPYKRRIQKCQEILASFFKCVCRVRPYFELRGVWNVQQV